MASEASTSTSTSRGGDSWNCSQLYGARVSTGGLPAAKEGRDLVGMTSPTIYVRTVLGIDRLWRRRRTTILKSHDISNQMLCFNKYISSRVFKHIALSLQQIWYITSTSILYKYITWPDKNSGKGGKASALPCLLGASHYLEIRFWTKGWSRNRFEGEKHVFICHHKAIYSKTPTLLAKITAAIPATQDTEKRQRLGLVF